MRKTIVVGSLLCGLVAGRASAQSANGGFQLNRYEPTPAGEWMMAVEHPWYSSSRWFAGGFTLDYGHNPLVVGKQNANSSFMKERSVIEHQLVGHVDLAASFLDRVLVSGTLPVTLFERGRAEGGITPLSSAAVGDPRFGLMVRLYGQPDASSLSVSLGAYLWVPVGSANKHAGDANVRFLPRLVLGGRKGAVRWSTNLGFLIRPTGSLGDGLTVPQASVGHEIQLGAAVGYAGDRFQLGPEATFGTIVGAEGSKAFDQAFTSLELMAAGQYLIADNLLIGAGVGAGLLRAPGTPDARALFRLAWAPLKVKEKFIEPIRDRDFDGIPDPRDACPDEKGVQTNDPRTNGCPPPPDRDGDGVLDRDDLCPDVPRGRNPDPARLGCPAADSDSDGVWDYQDLCPVVPQGANPDPDRLGCPDGDNDNDRYLNHRDMCPDQPVGLLPDPARPGCPLSDRDRDLVADIFDACPDKPGAPHPNPKKNGCPLEGGVIVRGNIIETPPVFFATDRDVILPKSFKTLTAVANAIIGQPAIKKVSIEGHTDTDGTREHNLDLSDRRARSVRRWLIANGIDPRQLDVIGYGPDRPLEPNTNARGKAKNRRVEFHIMDPGASGAQGGQAPTDSTPIPGMPPLIRQTPTQQPDQAPAMQQQRQPY